MQEAETSMFVRPVLPILLIGVGDFAVSAEALVTHFSHHGAIIGFKSYNSLEGLLFDYHCSGA